MTFILMFVLYLLILFQNFEFEVYTFNRRVNMVLIHDKVSHSLQVIFLLCQQSMIV